MTARHWTLLTLFVLLSGVLATANPPAKQEAYVGAYGPSYSATEDYLKRIAESSERIEKRLERIEAKIGGQQSTQDGALEIIGTRCLSCHQEKVAPKKGKSFVIALDDGTIPVLSLYERNAIIDQVGTGKMPLNGKLTDAEKKQLIEFFTKKEEQKKP